MTLNIKTFTNTTYTINYLEMSRSIKETKEMVKVTTKANKTLESKRKKGTSHIINT